jgi:hypothetical protein
MAIGTVVGCPNRGTKRTLGKEIEEGCRSQVRKVTDFDLKYCKCLSWFRDADCWDIW